MKKNVMRLACTVALGSLLVGCSMFQGKDISPNNIKNYTWSLATINGEAPIHGQRVTINFEPHSETTGRVYGIAQCNNYFGEYTTNGGSITFGSIGSTRMGCERAVMEQESIYIGSFATIDTIKLKDRELILSGGENKLSFYAESSKVIGTINFEGTIPADAEVIVRMQDTSMADAPAITVSDSTIKLDQPTAGSIPFSLNYAPQLVKSDRHYTLSVQAYKDGNLLYTNTSRIQVNFNKPNDMDLIEKRIDS